MNCSAPFDLPVPRDGYAWWYVDALSDDGDHGLTVIAFVGSVFSPYYARARRRGPADPLDHCSVNVALYGRHGRWAMTERGRGRVERSARRLRIGPSALAWEGGALVIRVREWAVPLPRPVRGEIRITPEARPGRTWTLDPDERHRWSPLAPIARVEVRFERPALAWNGPAYIDHNAGDEPLEAGFARWHWSRAGLADGGTSVLYDIVPHRGERRVLALCFGADGSVAPIEAPAAVDLPRSGWGIERSARAPACRPRLARTLEDTPFYARSLLSVSADGHATTAYHESLSLERFRAGWVQTLLPFRMPRRRGRLPGIDANAHRRR